MPPKFGLVIPKSKAQQGAQRVAQLQRSREAAALFNDDDSDDDADEQIGGKAEVNQMLLREAASSRTAKNIQRELEKAQEQDPSIFQYDEVYDDMAVARVKSDPRFERYQHGKKKEPKYIAQLLRAAKERKRRDDARIERAAQREREEEGDEFADKEEFVTEAYKKKLLEIKETEALEKLEEAEDVTTTTTTTRRCKHLVFF
ncbi:hypothetical protein PTSG_02220 [Salpingoeca rosetta]|uniref:Nuclear speckle splicing regulatory protein 1 N-terminal domain-containing protein n=1 Tax=Salpingoeca rosetta (strain ATCC 50818 / BSB-021) TaxID=946362 RepID=F2U1K1_SALR5|nr:uncharacterized protein PTSG_02220 [Salpingoeca rosetta]EGD81503.1 hypothetical protein PTSG_02220 [Salpingoeca rosetta]|eukprot:XP_004996707.1 hypothetical protein PTSG_02220 [Salpingoeca rosetta]